MTKEKMNMVKPPLLFSINFLKNEKYGERASLQKEAEAGAASKVMNEAYPGLHLYNLPARNPMGLERWTSDYTLLCNCMQGGQYNWTPSLENAKKGFRFSHVFRQEDSIETIWQVYLWPRGPNPDLHTLTPTRFFTSSMALS